MNVLLLQPFVALCLASVQLKQCFLSLGVFRHFITVYMDLQSGFSQYTHTLLPCRVWKLLPFSRFPFSLIGIVFLSVNFSKSLLIVEISSPANCHFWQDWLVHPIICLKLLSHNGSTLIFSIVSNTCTLLCNFPENWWILWRFELLIWGSNIMFWMWALDTSVGLPYLVIKISSTLV